MDNILIHIDKKRHLWLSYLYSMGCRKDLANDIVQDMYLRIDRYVKECKPNITYKGDLNYYFFWVILKNMYIDNRRKRNTSPIMYVSEYHVERHDEVYDELPEELFLDKHRSIVDYIEQNADDFLIDLFEDYFIKEYKITELSKQKDLTYWQTRFKLKKMKTKIRENYETRRFNREDNNRNRDKVVGEED